MNHFQYIAFMLPLSIFSIYAVDMARWVVFAKPGAQRPKLSEAVSAGWYITSGAAVALYFRTPCH
jgi:hypothetical protein